MDVLCLSAQHSVPVGSMHRAGALEAVTAPWTSAEAVHVAGSPQCTYTYIHVW